MPKKEKIDHGLDQPRGGGFTIMRELQRDLLREQGAPVTKPYDYDRSDKPRRKKSYDYGRITSLKTAGLSKDDPKWLQVGCVHLNHEQLGRGSGKDTLNYTESQPVEVSYDGTRYLSMRPVGATGDEGFAMSRGNFPKMIIDIDDLNYDRASVNGKPLDAPLGLDALHRIWPNSKFNDLEHSFDGVDRINIRGRVEYRLPPGKDWQSDVYSFTTAEMYAILELFHPAPYAD